MWKPISLSELTGLIETHIKMLPAYLLQFWQLIRIAPEKWQEEEYGNKGGGFWVVAILGNRVIWYNDIEEGFNISMYSRYGKIDECKFEQDDLNHSIIKLFE